jgi:hypothetical protein
VYNNLLDYSNIIQQTAVSHGKNIIIDSLREFFSKDVFFKYRADGFGFPLTPDLTDLPADIQEERTTRIFIGDIFRYDKRYWPSISVRYSSGRTYHVSMNQNYTTKYRLDTVLDGYGGVSQIHVPTHHVVVGAWDQSFDITIAAESIPDREELVDIVSAFFIAKTRQNSYESGLFIKNVSIGAEREEDWGNEKVYLQSITLETYSEWRREIPISAANIVEIINFCFNYNLSSDHTYISE